MRQIISAQELLSVFITGATESFWMVSVLIGLHVHNCGWKNFIRSDKQPLCVNFNVNVPRRERISNVLEPFIDCEKDPDEGQCQRLLNCISRSIVYKHSIIDLGALQMPNKMVGIESESRPVSGPNSPANEMAMAKKRRSNWDEVPTGGANQANQGLAKDQIQMDRRKMGKFTYLSPPIAIS